MSRLYAGVVGEFASGVIKSTGDVRKSQIWLVSLTRGRVSLYCPRHISSEPQEEKGSVSTTILTLRNINSYSGVSVDLGHVETETSPLTSTGVLNLPNRTPKIEGPHFWWVLISGGNKKRQRTVPIKLCYDAQRTKPQERPGETRGDRESKGTLYVGLTTHTRTFPTVVK